MLKRGNPGGRGISHLTDSWSSNKAESAALGFLSMGRKIKTTWKNGEREK